MATPQPYSPQLGLGCFFLMTPNESESVELYDRQLRLEL